MKIKCLSLTQPYATLVAIGAKKIETRSWSTSYRGPLAIHAAKGLGPVGDLDGLLELCGTQPFFDALYPIVPGHDRYCDRYTIVDCLPRGEIVAVCDLVDCHPTWRGGYEYKEFQGHIIRQISDQERAFGDYSVGRYAWLLGEVRALPEPIPAKGALSLWEWEGEL